mgnify:CR=1 FL=1
MLDEEGLRILGTRMNLDRIDLEPVVHFGLEDFVNATAMRLRDAFFAAVPRDRLDRVPLDLLVVDVRVDLLLHEQVDRLDQNRGKSVIDQRSDPLGQVIGLVRVARDHQIRARVDGG